MESSLNKMREIKENSTKISQRWMINSQEE